ncbi:TPA: hypothetical protein PC598_003961 [Morganella morganii]|nr:hypothetical protein [Morganella morganii]
MIIQNIINGLAWVYSIFDIKLLTVIAAGFTTYFGYQKISKKICVSYSISNGKLYGTHVTNFVVSNKRDNLIIISSVKMKIGNKGSIELIKFEDPLVLKGYDATLIDIPKYSEIYDKNGIVSIDISDKLSFSVITMSGKIIDCYSESPITKKSFEGVLFKSTQKFNNIVLTKKMGFIFSYRIKGKEKDVIIDNSGFIPGYTPFSYNSFDDMSEEAFGNFLISHGYHDYYDNYALLKVQDNLDVTLILNKVMMQNKIKNKTIE